MQECLGSMSGGKETIQASLSAISTWEQWGRKSYLEDASGQTRSPGAVRSQLTVWAWAEVRFSGRTLQVHLPSSWTRPSTPLRGGHVKCTDLCHENYRNAPVFPSALDHGTRVVPAAGSRCRRQLTPVLLLNASPQGGGLSTPCTSQ